MTDTFEPVAAPKPVEVELKYRVTSVAAAERYLTAPRVGAFDAHDQARSSRIEDRYVDTADGALFLAGYAVRLRQSKSGTTVSVKSLAATEGPGGAVRREELEGPADPVAPPSDWSSSAARALVLEHAGRAPLLEVVTVRQVRRKRQIRDAGTRIELSLDEVMVIAGGREVGRFAELEAELRRGGESRLAELAVIFDADLTLSRATESKLEAGLAILARTKRAGDAGVPGETRDAAADDAAADLPDLEEDDLMTETEAMLEAEAIEADARLDDAVELADELDGDLLTDPDILAHGHLVPGFAEFLGVIPSTDDTIESPEPPDDIRLVVG